MLQAIRDRVTGIVAIFVLGLLAVPFLFFGMESYMRAVPQDAVAVVGDDEIPGNEFQAEFARHRAELRQQMGDDYDDIATNQPTYRREFLETMIDELLLRQHTEQLGLVVSDRAIAEVLRQVPQFQIDGQFNPQAYRMALSAAGQTPRSFEQELRQDVLARLLPGAIADTVIVTEAEIDRHIRLQNQTRQFAMVEIPVERFHDDIDVTDADVEAYYEDNLEAFTTEEAVRLAYVELIAEDLVTDATLDEDELRRRYEAARERYLTPEARRASHILIETTDERDELAARELARELRDRIADGEDFAELAREYSDDFVSAEQGGDLGWIEPDDMVEAFEDALYAMDSEGDLSEPVETRFGWHVIRLDDIRPPEGMSFEEARSEILEEYVERQREDLYIELSERMVDLVFADDSSLEPLADDLGLEIQHTERFTRAGGDGIAANSEVVEAAFSDLVLVEGAVSDPIELSRNHMVAIKVDEHFPAEPRPLAEVESEIRSLIIDERAAEMARELAQRIVEAAGDGGVDLAAAAEAEGLDVEEFDRVGRNDFQHGPEFVQALFRLQDPGEAPELHILPRQGSHAVVRLEAVRPGEPAAASDMERNLARQQIQFSRMGYEITGLIEWLRDNTRIRVVEERL
ncbi:SurA N-terminal domain-containing protein [Wenzhouxiangella sp. AB-CW3]|uniref:SurA N-terminal domain-containing protein n=1 Tax=Wenzhouxiangella sp. AB-CW3 TaxID=2771012 RepID=UPI00168A96BE|nr:SurA N-terminal domain-containing protein [Wenzhouxiangella sp. AB-CW3]QOC21519.1 SurA N-terminal domain-containing protein [Wenzhouxiangella sp. AB-CW3]